MTALVPPLLEFRRRQTPRLTQADVARGLGVTTSHVSRIERFGTDSLTTALDLAKLTGLPVESFAPTGAVRV